jgi:hypothetical protein
MAPFVALGLKTVLTHVGVGMGAASFWRGAWYVLDDNLFPDNAAQSALASWGLGVAGMAASQGLVARVEHLRKTSGLSYKVARFGALYTIAMSVVLVWRGTWLGWDVLYEKYHHTYEVSHPDDPVLPTSETGPHPVQATAPGHATRSGVLSHALAVAALVGSGLFASVLAPPAATSVMRDLAVRATGQRNPFVTLWRPSPTPSSNVATSHTLASSVAHNQPPIVSHDILARHYHHTNHAIKKSATVMTMKRPFAANDTTAALFRR